MESPTLSAAESKPMEPSPEEGKPASLTCVYLPSLELLKSVIESRGSDFWLGTLPKGADVTERLAELTVAGVLAAKAFSHCFLLEVQDVASSFKALCAEFGRGHRPKLQTSRVVAEPGYAFVLVCEHGLSELARAKESMDHTDKRLSTDERLRRTPMQFAVVETEQMWAVAKRVTPKFFITAFANVDPETCKKRVIAFVVSEILAVEVYRSCLIAVVNDCRAATDNFTSQLGLGLRKKGCKATAGPGCVVLLLQEELAEDLGLPPSQQKSHEPKAEEELSLGELARRQSSAGFGLSTNGGSSPSRPPKSASEAPRQQKTKELKLGGDRSVVHELYRKQVFVLEKHLLRFLPTMPEDQITAAAAQEKLEALMRKPAGRFTKFRPEIKRIVRSYLLNQRRKVTRPAPDKKADQEPQTPEKGSSSSPTEVGTAATSTCSPEDQKSSQADALTSPHKKARTSPDRPLDMILIEDELTPDQELRSDSANVSPATAPAPTLSETPEETVPDAILVEDGEVLELEEESTAEAPAETPEAKAGVDGFEVDEFGFEVAAAELQEALEDGRLADAESTLETLKRAQPTTSLLQNQSWEAALSAEQVDGAGARIVALATEIRSRWRSARLLVEGKKPAQLSKGTERLLSSAYAALVELKALAQPDAVRAAMDAAERYERTLTELKVQRDAQRASASITVLDD